MSTVKVNNMKVYSGTDLAIGESSTAIKTVGNTTLGDSDSNTVTYNAKVNSTVLPDGDATRTLGSTTARWNLHVATATANTITSPSATDLEIAASQDIYLNPAGTGVGIGTASPSGSLHVSKADSRVRIEATTANNNCQLDFYNANGKYVNIGNSINTAGSLFEINEVSPSAGNVMTILTGGNIGIGTTAPSSTLHLKRTDDNAKHLTFEQTEGSGKKYHIIADDAGALAIQDDSATRIYVKSDGKVGIGTVTPTKELHVGGEAFVSSNLTVDGNLIVNGTTSTINSTTLTVDDKNIELGSVSSPSDTTADGGGITLKGASDYTILWTNATDKWTFNQGIDISAGDLIARNKIAVGNNHSPEATVDIYQASSAAVNGLRVRNNSGTLRQGVTAGGVGEINMLTDDDLSFGTNDTERARITSAGNVGIGTTSPSTLLHVEGSNAYLTLKNSDDTSNSAGSRETKINFAATQGNVNLATIQGSKDTSASNNNGQLIFYTYNGSASTEAIRIDSSQKVGIGTTSPQNKLDVEGAMAIGATYSGTTVAPTNGLIVEGNVGIGTNSPSSNLELESSSGDLVFEMDNNASGGANFKINNGAGNTRADFVLDDNTHITLKGQRVGIVQPSPAHTLDVTGDARITTNLTLGADLTVDTNTFKVDSSNNRVGIGTVTPSSMLEIESSSGDQIFEMDNNAANSANFQIQNGAGNSRVDLVMNDGSANTTLTFKGQKIGIGDTSPSFTLDVAGDAQITTNLTLGGVLSLADGSASAPSLTNTGDTNCGLFFSAADTLAFTAGGTSQVTFADGVIAPVTTNDIDLGTSSLRFANVYTMDLHLANERGDWTVIEEENYLSLRNNKNGKLFKIVMQEILED